MNVCQHVHILRRVLTAYTVRMSAIRYEMCKALESHEVSSSVSSIPGIDLSIGQLFKAYDYI